MLRGVRVGCACGFWAIGIRSACMRVRHNIGLVMHELVDKLVPSTFLILLWARPHIHGLVLCIAVVDGTPILTICLTVLREIQTQRNWLRVQTRPIVHTCTSLPRKKFRVHKKNTHFVFTWISHRGPRKKKQNNNTLQCSEEASTTKQLGTPKCDDKKRSKIKKIKFGSCSACWSSNSLCYKD